MNANNHRTVPLERNVEIAAEVIHHLVAADIHLCHQRALGSIEAGMDDRRVCLRGALTDILILFEYASIHIVAGKLSCNRTARNACAYNDHIIHHNVFVSFRKNRVREQNALSCALYTPTPILRIHDINCFDFLYPTT